MAAAPGAGVLSQASLHDVTSLADLDEFRRWAGERRDWLAFDTESAGLSPYADKHRKTQLGDRFAGWAFSPEWMGGAHEVLARYQGPLAAFNAVYDYRVLAHQSGLWLPWMQVHDAQLVAHLADSLAPTALKARTARDIDHSALAGEQALKEAMRSNGWTWATVPDGLPEYVFYAAQDAVDVAWLMDKHWPEVSTRFSAAYDLERAYARLAAKMMDAGLMIDRPYIQQTISEFADYRSRTLDWLAGHDISSPEAGAQVGRALTAIGVPDLWRTKTGMVQTDVKAMEHYAATCAAAIPLIEAVQGAKKAGKVVSTYLAKMLAMAGADDVIHYAIHTIGAQRTSRSSISDPSMQNYSRDIPQVRGGFIPRPGHVLVSFDADQIEMRLAAHFSGDRQLIEDFAHCDTNGESFFLNFAQTIYGPITKSDGRYSLTKNCCYSMVYGSGPDTAAATAGVTLDAIKPIHAAWKARYRGLDAWSRRLISSQKHRGHRPQTETWYGRRLFAQSGKEYGLVDYRVQGTAAECLKLAACQMDAAGYGDLLRLPVHDEMILEVPTGDAQDVLVSGTKILSATTADFRVPITWGGQIMTERWVK
jgi:DNA polymerase-1